MKRMLLIGLLLLTPAILSAQFKAQEKTTDIGKAIAAPATNLFLGIFNPDKFHMSHSFSMSYFTLGGHGVMLNSYVNTIDYQFNPALSMRLNLGLMNSPYNSLPNSPALNRTQFFGSGELEYRARDNMSIKVGVNVSPNYNPYLWYLPR